MHIRNATDNDLAAVIALNAFVQHAHSDALPDLFKAPADSRHIRDAFRDFLADPASLMLLAEDTQSVGYLWAQFQNRPEGWARFEQRLLYIQHLAVAPKYRRRGAGGLLLTKAVDLARAKGIKRVELDVWSFNSEARHFYGKHGFKVFNERMALCTDAP